MSDERVVPGETGVINYMKHLVRYNFALQFVENKTVLDLACGTGYGSFLLASVAIKVSGADISREAIHYAKKYYQRENLTFYEKDIMDMDGYQAEALVSFETIEHLDDLEKTQEKFLSMVKPGGLIIFSVPLNEFPGQNEHHKHVFTLETARDLFSGKTTLVTEAVQHSIALLDPDSIPGPIPFIYYVGVVQLPS